MLFKDELKKLRSKIGLSQAALSSSLEIPTRSWENWESGVRQPVIWVQKLLLDKLESMNIVYTVEFKVKGECWQEIDSFNNMKEAKAEFKHLILSGTDEEKDKGDCIAIFFNGEILDECEFDGERYI